MNRIITYKIINDENDKLKKTAKIACNFWNRFILPNSTIIIRLGIFSSISNTIARSYIPYINDGTTYGRVEFNKKFLNQYTDYDIAGTLIHEIGHTLGFGWEKWINLFDKNTGIFTSSAINAVKELQNMFVETNYGDGTQYSHWDEEKFDKEVMTGFKDKAEYVLPVTIKVMQLFGHDIIEDLIKKTDLEKIIKEVENVVFSKSEIIEELDLEYFEETELFEEVYITKL